MSLTNLEYALIHPEKLIDYLLLVNHSVGKLKAKFFRELVVNEENVTFWEQELSKIVRHQDVTEVITTEHGTQYVIIGTINTTKNKSVTILDNSCSQNGTFSSLKTSSRKNLAFDSPTEGFSKSK